MMRIALLVLLASIFSCNAINCPRVKPDGSVPQCVECTNCDVPAHPTESILGYFDNTTNAGWGFRIGTDPTRPYYMTVTPRHGGVNLRLEVSGKAPDTYRVFKLYKENAAATKDFWATGNNKGMGVICETTMDWNRDEFSSDQKVLEWDHVPANACF